MLPSLHMASTPRRPRKGRAAAGKPAAKSTKPAPRPRGSRTPPAAPTPLPPPEARPVGRPLSPEFEAKREEILDRIAGGEQVLRILSEPGMPARSTFYRMLVVDREFSDSHARARESWAHAMADEMVLIADEVAYDTKTITRGDYSVDVPDTEWIQRTKIRIDTRMKLMGQYHARQFGPKVDVTSDGEKLETGVLLMPPLDPPPAGAIIHQVATKGRR